ncbi:MAG: acyl-CoA dehydrogenase family protein [Anaerolineae bacterium]|nr:acyl-CoA dehydrogenase family protein [Anaerolineae bacterium]
MLDFTLDQEQEMLDRTVRRFAEERMRKAFRDAEEDGKLPPQVVQAGWEIGLLPTGLPEEYGGFGEYSVVTNAVAVEGLAWGDLALTLAILAPNLVAIPLMIAGTEAQKEQYLPDFGGGSPPQATAALTEPRLKWNPRKLETTAVKEDGDYVLNGVKAFVPLADSAELFLVYAAEGEQTQAFLVPAGSEGLTTGEREKLMGLNALPMFRVELDGVRVPAENKLGGADGIDFGLLLNHSRVALGAAATGVARAGYEYAREYAKQRVQFGEPIAHRQSIAFMLAEMAIDVESARLLVWEAAWKLDQGDDATREAAVLKQYIDKIVVDTADRAVQVLGGYGYIREYPVELWLRNARAFAHFDGMAMI